MHIHDDDDDEKHTSSRYVRACIGQTLSSFVIPARSKEEAEFFCFVLFFLDNHVV